MKRYLVTGAAGFVGSFIAKRLLDQGAEVWTIDNLSTGYKENIPKGTKFIQGGCQDEESIKQLSKTKFDAILHIAGQSSGEISFENPVYDLRTNTESTLRLVQYALANGCSRFLYASSMSVYGNVAERPIAEDHPTNPLSFYGVGKLASEKYMSIYGTKGLAWTALRYFNIYGPNQNMDNLKQGMVSIYLAQLLKNDKVIVKGSNDRFRDFIYIDDLVDITTQMIDDEKAFNKAFNIATGVKTTVKELLDKQVKISGLKKDIVYEGNTPGDQKGIYADISQIKKLFGFKPKYSLDQGLEKMISWARKDKWLQKV
jgi:UDP-glucose 4-epimerase